MIKIETQDDLFEVLRVVEEYQRRATEMAKLLAKMRGRTVWSEEFEITIQNGEFVAEYEIYEHGETEYFNLTIHKEYFFDDEWEKTALKVIEDREKERLEKERRRQEQKRASAEKAEYNQYLKLKAKFGTTEEGQSHV